MADSPLNTAQQCWCARLQGCAFGMCAQSCHLSTGTISSFSSGMLIGSKLSRNPCGVESTLTVRMHVQAGHAPQKSPCVALSNLIQPQVGFM